QVTPDQFAEIYNISQLVAGPTLAAATFSPLLFGRRLWSETRIAVFQQSIDTRRSNIHHRHQHPRVRFGESWVNDSVLDIFRQDIALFRLVLTTETQESSLRTLEQGRIPDLPALRLHNGTVYRWNRPCYGVGGGKPHLRIENRILPSGPTVLDEMANAAFWFGLLRSIATDVGDVRPRIGFDSVKTNFLAAARGGLQAQFRWIDGGQHSAQDLILRELLPRSREGLEQLGLETDEIDRYLPVIEERVSSLRTGSTWLMGSLEKMEGHGTPSERIGAVMAALRELQRNDEPVHTWPPAELDHGEGARHHHFSRVADLMTTDLFTVAPDEVIDLVAAVMDWKYIHHIPVEDGEHRLVGLVTHRRLLRYLAQNQGKDRRPVPVSEVMACDLITVSPQTSSLEAVRLMKAERIACLPVVEDGHLVGIITERDFIKVTDKLLEDFLSSC
ncbi:MAG: CBS domain-containing protein, partial [Holophagales bacterium]|nr:CBS domain-containing protein [Holophagales bacterium]